jgi:hypothetical protein
VGEGGARSAPGEGSIFGQLCEKVFENRIASLQDVVVPISKDAKSLARQYRISRSITQRVSVLAAVDLYDDPSFKAHEIKDVRLEGNLPAEFVPGKPAVPQNSPHRGFCISSSPTHSLGVPKAGPTNRTMADTVRHDPSPGSTCGRATLSHKGRG